MLRGKTIASTFPPPSQSWLGRAELARVMQSILPWSHRNCYGLFSAGVASPSAFLRCWTGPAGSWLWGTHGCGLKTRTRELTVVGFSLPERLAVHDVRVEIRVRVKGKVAD